MKQVGIVIAVDGIAELDEMKGTDEEQLLDITNTITQSLMDQGVLKQVTGMFSATTGDSFSEYDEGRYTDPNKVPFTEAEIGTMIEEIADPVFANFGEYMEEVRERMESRLYKQYEEDQ